MIADVGDRRQIVHRVDRDVERVGDRGVVTVLHLDRDRGGTKRVGGWCEGDRAIRSTSAQHDVAVGNQRRIAGCRGDFQNGGRVSTSPTVNGIAAVEVSSLINWLATSETDGRSFTELT